MCCKSILEQEFYYMISRIPSLRPLHLFCLTFTTAPVTHFQSCFSVHVILNLNKLNTLVPLWCIRIAKVLEFKESFRRPHVCDVNIKSDSLLLYHIW